MGRGAFGLLLDAARYARYRVQLRKAPNDGISVARELHGAQVACGLLPLFIACAHCHRKKDRGKPENVGQRPRIEPCDSGDWRPGHAKSDERVVDEIQTAEMIRVVVFEMRELVRANSQE